MRCISILAPPPPLQSPCNKSFTKIVVLTPTAIYQYNHEARRWDAALFNQEADLCLDMKRIRGYQTALLTTSTRQHFTTLRNNPWLKTTTHRTRLSNQSLVYNRFSTTVPHQSRHLLHHLIPGEVRLGCRRMHAMESVTRTDFSLKGIWKNWWRSRASL